MSRDRQPRGSSRRGGIEATVALDATPYAPLYGDSWERRLVVPSFSASRPPNSVVLEKRTFAVPPGRYTVRVLVRDLNSGTTSTANERIEVPDYSKIPVGFADLEMGTVDSTGVFTPTPTRRYGLDVGHLAARAAMFDRRAGNWPRHYTLQTRIHDEAGTVLVSSPVDVNLSRSGDSVLVRPAQTDLFLGDYVMEVSRRGKARWHVERTFHVDEGGPQRGKEFARMLEPLSYTASSEEIEKLRSLPPDQQGRGWEEFWKRRDPSPETPRNEAMIDFFRRVRYAERHFQGYGPGWRSDMGRI
jgi:GWxTD domain-containing protein